MLPAQEVGFLRSSRGLLAQADLEGGGPFSGGGKNHFSLLFRDHIQSFALGVWCPFLLWGVELPLLIL